MIHSIIIVTTRIMIIIAGILVYHGEIAIIVHIVTIIILPITPIGMVITLIMIPTGVTVLGTPIIMDIIRRIIIIIIGADIGPETTTHILKIITAINAIGIVVGAIEEIEILIEQIAALMDIQ